MVSVANTGASPWRASMQARYTASLSTKPAAGDARSAVTARWLSPCRMALVDSAIAAVAAGVDAGGAACAADTEAVSANTSGAMRNVVRDMGNPFVRRPAAAFALIAARSPGRRLERI